ncbi:MAG: SDR family oxidoreductase [Burkholderiales bacterium]
MPTAKPGAVILLTGANGTTGHAIIRHLVNRGATVRGLVRSRKSAETIEALGAQAHVGNLRDKASLDAAFDGADRVYHLPPGLQPDEVDIARNVINAAQRAQVRLFGYHSVSYPQLPAVRFHWEKLKAETEILHSGLTFFIVRPCQYMQNVLWSLPRILDEGVFALPWSPERRMVSVDVEDMGEAIAIILTKPGFEGGTYEFCSVERALTRHEMAERLAAAFGRTIVAGQKPIEEALQAERFKHYTPDQIEQMGALYRFFDRNGTPGFNNRTLAMILGREPTSYAAFARRLAAEMDSTG